MELFTGIIIKTLDIIVAIISVFLDETSKYLGKFYNHFKRNKNDK
ncbi:hypothetical protein [Staphylococcus caeli]|uniref:Uncharacterized protein n=1 Tax=Staphylococcus caeli TaxID=2201815 RepID=A0A1D4MW86_9STAP|nr:hypothetical protein [Staphylococcus caeli]SCT02681.1 Uncharacterised protein [Staphylococcus caeli]SCT24688.1 Uncharacterised protein [Staphylococcus caeli]